MCVHHMPYRHGIVHRLGSRWADESIAGVLQSDVTAYKEETPSCNAASDHSYMGRAM